MEADAPKTPVAETKTSTTTVKKSDSKKMIIVIVVLLLLCCCCSIIVGAIYLYKRGAQNDGYYTPGFFNSVPDTGSTGNTGSTDDLYSTTLPSGFPSDVPIYPGARIVFGVKNDTDSYSASLSSTAAAGAVQDYYKNEIVKKGWTIENEGNIFGYVITASKGDRELNVVVLEVKDTDGKPVQSITLAVQPKN